MSLVTAPVRGCVQGVASAPVVSAGGTPFSPTLDYNYISTMALGGLETFTRASTGWYFNSSGVLTSAATNAARFDYDPSTARTNLALRSAAQDNSGVWTAAQITVTADAVTAPDGTLTGDTFTENSGSTSRGTAQNVTIATNVTQTFSVYAKAGTRSWLRLMLNTGSDSVIGWFNLGSGVVGSTQTEGTGASPTVAISDAGSGWYRCALTGIPASADSGTIGAFIRMATADNEFSYQGNGAGALHVWGAQLELGSSATAYIATAASAVTVCTARGLLMEEARTNLFLNSATGVTQSCTVTAAAHTLSFWGTGTITLTGTSTAGPLVGTGAANRVTLTFTPTAGSLTLTVSGSCTNVQLELGSFATSPIVTVGSTVTRAADICTITPLGSWFTASAGTLLGEWVARGVKATGVQTVASIDDGTNSQRVTIFETNSTGITQASVAATTTILTGTRAAAPIALATEKMAIAWDASSSRATLNGVVIGAGSGGAPVVTQMRIGHRTTDQLNGWVRRVAYAPARADNTALQTLTT